VKYLSIAVKVTPKKVNFLVHMPFNDPTVYHVVTVDVLQEEVSAKLLEFLESSTPEHQDSALASCILVIHSCFLGFRVVFDLRMRHKVFIVK
jgi:hypothetical protein